MKVLRCDPPRVRSGATSDYVDYRTPLAPTSSASISPIPARDRIATLPPAGEREIAARPAGQILINASRGEVLGQPGPARPPADPAPTQASDGRLGRGAQSP